jgi:hypothetical protein
LLKICRKSCCKKHHLTGAEIAFKRCIWRQKPFLTLYNLSLNSLNLKHPVIFNLSTWQEKLALGKKKRLKTQALGKKTSPPRKLAYDSARLPNASCWLNRSYLHILFQGTSPESFHSAFPVLSDFLFQFNTSAPAPASLPLPLHLSPPEEPLRTSKASIAFQLSLPKLYIFPMEIYF